jgi:hypothetical protein
MTDEQFKAIRGLSGDHRHPAGPHRRHPARLGMGISVMTVVEGIVSSVRARPTAAVARPIGSILKRGLASRLSGQCRDDDYDVLEDGVIVGRIFKVPVAPQGPPLNVGERP